MIGKLICAILAFACIAACKSPTAKPTRTEIFEFDAQVLAMPSRHATMLKLCPCFAEFKDSDDGRIFYIGSPGASPNVEGFIGSLKEGQSFFLPDEFMRFLDSQKKSNQPADAK